MSEVLPDRSPTGEVAQFARASTGLVNANDWRRYQLLARRAAYVGLLVGISQLPSSMAYRLARQIGRWNRQQAGATLDQQRYYMQSRMRTTEAEAEKWLTRSFELKAISDLECCLYQSVTSESVDRMFRYEGLDNLNSALDKGKGAILYSFHDISYEHPIIGIGLHGTPVKLIVKSKPQYPRNPIDQWLYSKRIDKMESIGNEYVETFPSNPFLAAKCTNALRKNELIGIQIDSRAPQDADVELEFLNEIKSFPLGSALMSRASGAPLIDFSCLRPTNGAPSVIRFGEPIYSVGNPTDIVRLQAARLEEAIKGDPSSWSLWSDRFNRRRIRRWLSNYVPADERKTTRPVNRK